MNIEDGFRAFLGYGTERQITFMGKAYAIRANGLLPLIRYSRSSVSKEVHQIAEEDAARQNMAALYQLLEDCLINFREFANDAFMNKADVDEIAGAKDQLIEFYTCRKMWPGMRLIGYVAHNLDELDGKLIKTTGRGIAGLSAREACNLALATCLDGLEDDDRQQFLFDLEYEGSAESEALQMVRQMQAARAAQEAPDG